MKLIHIVEKIPDLFWFSIFLSPNRTLFILTSDGSNGEKIYQCKALILSHLLTPLASYQVQFLQLITQGLLTPKFSKGRLVTKDERMRLKKAHGRRGPSLSFSKTLSRSFLIFC